MVATSSVTNFDKQIELLLENMSHQKKQYLPI